MYIITVPHKKAMAMEINIPEIMVIDLPALIYSDNAAPASLCQILNKETATAEPSNSNTRETVVEVGKPKVLNTSSRITSVIITAKNNIITSGKVNFAGKKTPLLAISIIPPENKEPKSIPAEATVRIIQSGATLAPILELRKLTASFDTPTTKSNTANPNNTKMIIRYMLLILEINNFAQR